MNPSQADRGERIALWLDCDPGHDDAFAILLAAHHPRLNLLGISTVHGNASLQRTTANAGSVLTAIGKSDIPVHPGAAKPFCRKEVHAPDIHGLSGLDGTALLPTPACLPITSVNAILATREALLSQPADSVYLVATGALTNIALLVATFPELVCHMKGLSIMGGAVGRGFTSASLGTVKGEEGRERVGNVTRWAEFNIYCDPEAAHSLFSNPLLAAKTTLISLDLTHQVLATPRVQQHILHRSSSSLLSTQAPSTLRQMFYELLIFFAHTYAKVFDITAGPPLHDPLAVAVLLFDHGIGRLGFVDGEGERWKVEVVMEGVHSEIEAERGQVGRTVVKASQRITDGKVEGVRIMRGLDVERFWSVLEECVTIAEEWVG